MIASVEFGGTRWSCSATSVKSGQVMFSSFTGVSPQPQLALHELVLLVQVPHELAKRLARHGDIVVYPSLHREVVFQVGVIVHFFDKAQVLLEIVLHRLHHLEAGLQKRTRAIAEGVDESIDVEILFPRPHVEQAPRRR